MVINDGANSVEIIALDRAAWTTPAKGDVELSLTISSNGFTGQGFAWVDAAALQTFVDGLQELETSRRGTAVLEGMSPGFRLCIRSVDHRGHLAVEGCVVDQVHHGENGPYEHSVRFGFEFDPTRLPGVLTDFRDIANGGG